MNEKHSVGKLILAATPIGSHFDASLSLASKLADADIIAAEDTRRLDTLTRRLNVFPKGNVISYFEGNESSRTPELIAQLQQGKEVLLVTDAGMPSVSDPGYRLVSAAIAAGIKVSALPGPSAALTALAVSGLPVDKFCFEGFLPRKTAERRHRLSQIADEARTMIFFEAPHRLMDFLSDAAEIFGHNRNGVICRELTKPHEEIIRGTLAELSFWASNGVRGEITIVIAGNDQIRMPITQALSLVIKRIEQGETLSRAVSEVSEMTGANRKKLYQATLEQKNKNE